MNLNFIILYVQNIEKEKAFYVESLGMAVVLEHTSPAFATLRTDGGAVIGLQDRAFAQFPPGLEKPGSVELSFEVEDVDATWRHWKDNGVEMVAYPMDLPFGRYFMAKDPEGYYLSVYRFAQK